MKYAFIVNPVSGQGKHERFAEAVDELIRNEPDKDISIYYTRGEGDATVLADMIATETDDEIISCACGGDGTVQETANGIYGHDNAILGIVPIGSGNDFLRQIVKSNGGKASDYIDPVKQLSGAVKSMDLIRLSWTENGQDRSRFVTNGVNIGFDGNTAALAHDLKGLPGVSGTGSYLLAVAANLAKKKGQKLKITADGKEFYNGRLLLSTAANGGFCGGGVNSCPFADMNDGLIELLAIRDLPRRRFVALFPKYKAGKLFDIKGFDELALYTQAKSIVIEPLLDPLMKFVADGEILETGMLKIDVIENAIKVMTI